MMTSDYRQAGLVLGSWAKNIRLNAQLEGKLNLQEH
jgi:hypothetical protein